MEKSSKMLGKKCWNRAVACGPIAAVSIRAVPNIRFIFASVPNSDTNSLFVFERIVHPKTNTNSMTLTRPRRDERTAVGV